MMCYVYILECADGSLYTGWTNNIEKRMKGHNLGKASKYTRSRLPVALRYVEEIQTKSLAMQREFAIKKLSRNQKLLLIKNKKS